MTFVVGTNEAVVPKYFLQDLHDIKVEKAKPKPICVAGIVSQLCISGSDMAAFLLEDSTGIWRCEFFLDRCTFGDNFKEGMPVKIKGELRINNYEEIVIRVSKLRVLDDPNEEFIFYLEALQSKLEGNKTITKVVEAPEAINKPSVNHQVDKVSQNNICSAIMSYLYDQAKLKVCDTVVAANIINLKEFDVYKKKNEKEFNSQFDACLKNLEAEAILIPTKNPDSYSFDKPRLERLGYTLYERLKNEDDIDFTFDRIYTLCNQCLNTNMTEILSKELVYRIVNELYKNNMLYKADKNSERYGVS